MWLYDQGNRAATRDLELLKTRRPPLDLLVMWAVPTTIGCGIVGTAHTTSAQIRQSIYQPVEKKQHRRLAYGFIEKREPASRLLYALGAS